MIPKAAGHDVPWEAHRHDFDELELIGDDMFTLGVPTDSSAEFRKYVFAAAKTVMMDNRSVDHILKLYGDHWSFQSTSSPGLTLVRAMSQMTKRHVRETTARMSNIDAPGGAAPGLIAAHAALLRLQSSFRGAVLMCCLGLRFEAAVIARLILEQLAWAYVIHGFQDMAFVEVAPTKCVSRLQALWPGIPDVRGRQIQGRACIYR